MRLLSLFVIIVIGSNARFSGLIGRENILQMGRGDPGIRGWGTSEWGVLGPRWRDLKPAERHEWILPYQMLKLSFFFSPQLLILDTLHRCMRVKHQEALECNAMAIFTSLLENPDREIRAKAAMNIKELRLVV